MLHSGTNSSLMQSRTSKALIISLLCASKYVALQLGAFVGKYAAICLRMTGMKATCALLVLIMVC